LWSTALFALASGKALEPISAAAQTPQLQTVFGQIERKCREDLASEHGWIPMPFGKIQKVLLFYMLYLLGGNPEARPPKQPLSTSQTARIGEDHFDLHQAPSALELPKGHRIFFHAILLVKEGLISRDGMLAGRKLARPSEITTLTKASDDLVVAGALLAKITQCGRCKRSLAGDDEIKQPLISGCLILDGFKPLPNVLVADRLLLSSESWPKLYHFWAASSSLSAEFDLFATYGN
jgi:hypothetical protein